MEARKDEILLAIRDILQVVDDSLDTDKSSKFEEISERYGETQSREMSREEFLEKTLIDVVYRIDKKLMPLIMARK